MGKFRVGHESIDVNFAPDGVMEILQNVRTIIATRKGTVSLDREFGLPWDAIDQPMPVAQMLMRSEVIDAIERYEPRVRVESVDFLTNTEKAMEGILRPVVTVSIKGSD